MNDPAGDDPKKAEESAATSADRDPAQTEAANGLLDIGTFPNEQALQGFARKASADGVKLVVGALVVDDAGRIYVQRRSAGRAVFPGCWDIVGGHAKAGETPLEALAREVQEETGWTLTDVGPVVEVLDWSAGDGVRRREVDFLARAAGDLERPHLEPGKHDEGRWLRASETAVLLEGRDPDDRWVYDVVVRGFKLLATWRA